MGGQKIPYTEAGKGPLLILLHGGLGDHRSLDDQVKLLSRDFRAVAFPHRFYGGGAWGDLSANVPYFEQAAADVAAVINAIGTGPAHIVGWSHGSRVAHLAAMNHPDQIKSAYLFEGVTAAKMDPDAAKALGKSLGPIVSPVVEAAKSGDNTVYVRAIYDRIIVGKPGAYEKMPDARKLMYDKFAPALRKAMASKRPEPLSCEAMRNHKVPMVLVRGEVSADYFQLSLADKYWKSCIDIVTVNGTHLWPREDINAFAESVTAFATKH